MSEATPTTISSHDFTKSSTAMSTSMLEVEMTGHATPSGAPLFKEPDFGSGGSSSGRRPSSGTFDAEASEAADDGILSPTER